MLLVCTVEYFNTDVFLQMSYTPLETSIAFTVRVPTNWHKNGTFLTWIFVEVLAHILDSPFREEAKRKKKKTLGEHQAICSHLCECFYFAVVQFAFISFICVIVLITIFRCTAPRYTTLGTALISGNALLSWCFPLLCPKHYRLFFWVSIPTK